jgi:hypothetical protein
MTIHTNSCLKATYTVPTVIFHWNSSLRPGESVSGTETDTGMWWLSRSTSSDVVSTSTSVVGVEERGWVRRGRVPEGFGEGRMEGLKGESGREDGEGEGSRAEKVSYFD